MSSLLYYMCGNTGPTRRRGRWWSNGDLLLAAAVCSCGNPGRWRGGWDFQRVWEGPGVGGRWPEAFHARSDSTAGVGGRLGPEIAPVHGRAARGPCVRGPREPPDRAVGSRRGRRAEPRGRFLRPPPPFGPFGLALSRTVVLKEGNETPCSAMLRLDGIYRDGWYLWHLSDGIYG